MAMLNKAGDSQYTHYSNQDLEALLSRPGTSEEQKKQVRAELTRRLRDDLLRSAQEAEVSKRKQRRKRAWKVSKLFILLVIVLLCAISVLCILLFVPPDLFPWNSNATSLLPSGALASFGIPPVLG
jgi:Flp pilus assembly protein TadB